MAGGGGQPESHHAAPANSEPAKRLDGQRHYSCGFEFASSGGVTWFDSRNKLWQAHCGGSAMRKSLFALAILALAASAVAEGRSVRVKGYFRKDGTYVAPHRRTSPDNSRNNNWSTKGNVNPYTGKSGTTDSFSYPSSTPRDSFQPVLTPTPGPEPTPNPAPEYRALFQSWRELDAGRSNQATASPQAPFAGQAIRSISFDICFPATAEEYVALGKNAILMLDSSSAVSTELPLRTAYALVSGFRIPLHRVALLQKGDDADAGRTAQVSFYLLPIQYMKVDTQILADFNGDRKAFGITSFSAKEGIDQSAPAFARLDEYDTPGDADTATLAAVIAREYPDYVQ